MNASVIAQPKLPTKRIQNAIVGIIKQKAFVKSKMSVIAGARPGDNFMGDVYRIIIEGTLSSGIQTFLHLFCKVLPQNETKRNQFKARESFLREIKIIEEILPQFQELQNKNSITEDNFNSFINYYVSSIEEFEEFIVMEDLKEKNYVMFDRRSNVDFEHVKLVMTELGKLHAFSFAMRDQKPEVFESYKQLKEIFVKDGEGAPPENRIYFEELFKKARDTLEIDEVEFIEKFNKFEEIYHKFDHNTRGDLLEPYAVVTHGDCWTNNMLFQYKDEKPERVKFIDWQLSRYTSPVLDLMYYIFCCTDKAVRDVHYEDMLAVYYESLSQFLQRLGSNVEDLFPYSVFQEQLKHLGHTGLILAIMTISNFVSEPDEVHENRNESGNVDGFAKIKDKYRVRMSDVIRDMVKLGYI